MAIVEESIVHRRETADEQTNGIAVPESFRADQRGMDVDVRVDTYDSHRWRRPRHPGSAPPPSGGRRQ